MSLTRLEQEGKIKKITLNPNYVRDQLSIADYNIIAAKRNLDDADPITSYTCSYTAIHAAGRALMGFKGYTPAGQDKHHNVELFLVVPDN